MATTSANFSPTFPIPQDGNEAFNRYMLITVLSYFDSHTHASNSGAPVKRLYYGAASGTAGGIAAGNAGSVFIETSTPYKFWYDDGTIWRELVATTIAQTLTNKTLTAPVLTDPTVNGIATFDNNTGVIRFKDTGSVARTVLQVPSDDSVRISPVKSTGHIYLRDFAATQNNVDIDDSGNVTALGYLKGNGYRAALQPNGADYLVQGGTGTSSNAGAATATFGTAFASGTPTIAGNAVSTNANNYSVNIESITTSNFTFSVRDAANARVNAIAISYIAMGVR